MIPELKNKVVGVLCGGESQEREVSLRSGRNVFQILQKEGYKVVLIDLTDENLLLELLQKNQVDIVFNTLHGRFGEDGTLQFLLDFNKIPYTGSSGKASAVGMDKLLTKLISKGCGLAVADYYLLGASEKLGQANIQFGFPWFVKPKNGGSSVDNYLIKNSQDLQSVKLTLKKEYLIEEFIEGIEITVGVLQEEEQYTILPSLQLESSNEFYDYEAKYTEGKTKFIIPARISTDMEKKVGIIAKKIHQLLGCSGATRTDFIIKDNKAFLLEINTSPGMTLLSDIPAAAKASGISDIQLCESLLKSSLKRMEHKS